MFKAPLIPKADGELVPASFVVTDRPGGRQLPVQYDVSDADFRDGQLAQSSVSKALARNS